MIVSFLAVLVFAFGLAFLARRGHHETDPRDFFAAHGQFGAVLFFMLSVGETYSIGSLLGFPGAIVAKGSSMALWFMGYILLAGPVGFLLYPLIWKAGRRTGAITLPELFRAHFNSAALERFVAVFLVVLMLPLGTMQFIGVAGVVSVLAPGATPFWSCLLAALIAFLFAAIAGLRAAALISILKDALMLSSVLLLGVLALLGWHDHALRPLAPALQHESGPALDATLFVLSTIIVQAMGFCIAPQTVAASFAAHSPGAIRRAQGMMPVYMGLFPLLFVIAGYALTHDVGLARPDGAFLAVAASLLPGWALGIVLGAVVLTALVWLASMCLALAAIVTRNIVPDLAPSRQKQAGLAVIAAYLLFSALSAGHASVMIASLNTLFYLGLVQLLPGIALIVFSVKSRVSRLLPGLVCGLALALVLRQWGVGLHGINPGLIGLAVNALMVAFMSGASRRQ